MTMTFGVAAMHFGILTRGRERRSRRIRRMVSASRWKSNSSLTCFASSSTAVERSNFSSVRSKKAAAAAMFFRSRSILSSCDAFCSFTATVAPPLPLANRARWTCATEADPSGAA